MTVMQPTGDKAENRDRIDLANGEKSPAYLQDREAIHRQMLSAVSHDLKTPLASIVGSLEIYQRMGPQLPVDTQKTLIETALNEAYRLDSFLTNILDMAKLENNLVPIRREQANVRHLIEDLIAAFGKRSSHAAITVSGDASVEITTDSTLFSRVITLLLDNAFKHAGPNPSLALDYEALGTGLRVTVRDDGPGIPSDKREEIFDKYTRLGRGDRQNAGTGLGLSIARIIAQRLGGDLKLEPVSAERVGASFRLTVAR